MSQNWMESEYISLAQSQQCKLVKTFSFDSDNAFEQGIIRWQIQYFIQVKATRAANKNTIKEPEL